MLAAGIWFRSCLMASGGDRRRFMFVTIHGGTPDVTVHLKHQQQRQNRSSHKLHSIMQILAVDTVSHIAYVLSAG